MKLENQVVSLEIAKKLKELGVKQESLYYHWVHAQGNEKGELYGTFHNQPHNPKEGWLSYSAFTVAELGEMLPNNIQIGEKLKWLYSIKSNLMNAEKTPRWIIRYSSHGKIGDIFLETVENTEADARAKMLIYLLENKFINF